jgi:hypothetical protein
MKSAYCLGPSGKNLFARTPQTIQTHSRSWFNHQPVGKKPTCVQEREESDCVYLFEKPVFQKEHTADTFFKVVFIFPVLPLPHNSAMIITYLLYFVAALPVLFYFFITFSTKVPHFTRHIASPRLFIKVICIARERARI